LGDGQGVVARYHEFRSRWVPSISDRKLAKFFSPEDKDIDGIEKAESLDDEERVDDKTWHSELAKEKDLLEEEAEEEAEEDEMDVEDGQKK
jgi:hypothetical protein